MPPPETKNPPPAGTGEGQKASDSGKRLNRYGTARSVTDALLARITDAELRAAGITKPDRVRHCGTISQQLLDLPPVRPKRGRPRKHATP